MLSWIDLAIIIIFGLVSLWLGIYSIRRSTTSEQFMVAGHSIPAWAAGLAVMSTYTSSISYIATPGKAFDDNWHPLIFALCIFPVAWFVSRYIVPHYWKLKLISVYEFLEQKLGTWARSYAGISFVFYMVGRVAVILYLAGLLLGTFVPIPLSYLIIAIGGVTIIYTLVGGMRAVIWTDVFQSFVMIVGILYCVFYLSFIVFGGRHPEMVAVLTADKFSLGSLKLSLSGRTVWVMVIYGITENLRNLMADQNYVQKYASVSNVADARKSIWTAMLIYIPLTLLFVYLGTTLFAFYSGKGLPSFITKGDQVFPHFIATQLPVGLKGLVISAILAAAMSTISSVLNSSATVTFLDFYKRYLKPGISEKKGLIFLRISTVFWGAAGTGFALLMIQAKSALDIWWQISGIFGGAILGLFVIAFLRPGVRAWIGISGIIISIVAICWGTFARKLPADWVWMECRFDEIITGAVGTFLMIALVFLISYLFPGKTNDRRKK